MQPSISVVVPTYNRGRAVSRTIESVLSQDLRAEEVEILIVDDGSTDDTFSVLRELYGANARVRLFTVPNGGVARARNFGLAQARGEFIAFLDHDDLWLPQKLRLQLDAIQQSEKIGVVYCDWKHFEGREILPDEDARVWKPRFGLKKRVLGKLLTGNFIISMSVPLIRTSALRLIGGFDSAVVPCDDWDVWIRLAKDNEFVGITEALVLYHQHENQQSQNVKSMLVADRRTRWKNRQLGWPHPYTLIGLYRPNYLHASQPTYLSVKEALFAQQWKRAWQLSLTCFTQRPLLSLTPQWMVLMARLIRCDSRRY